MERIKTILQDRFFWTLLFCVVYLVGFSQVSRRLGLAFWQPANPFLHNLYVFEHRPERADIVFLGSSRGQTGILPSVIEEEVFRETGTTTRVFNLSQAGGGIRSEHLVLRDVLKDEKRPSILILEVHSLGFSSNSPLINNIYFKYFATQADILRSYDTSVSVCGIGPRAQGFIRDASNLLWMVAKNPWQPDARAQLARIESHKGAIPFPVEKDPNRMTPEERELAQQIKETNLRHVQWLAKEVPYEIEGVADRAFRDIISVCRGRGIHLIILCLPVRLDVMTKPEYREYQKFLPYITNVCGEEHIRFFNLQEENIALTPEDFWDRTHVNKVGAAVLSRYIAREIILPARNMLSPTSTRARLTIVSGRSPSQMCLLTQSGPHSAFPSQSR
jgi:hypothetical protein